MCQIKKKGARTFASYEDLVKATATRNVSEVNTNILRISQREDSLFGGNG